MLILLDGFYIKHKKKINILGEGGGTIEIIIYDILRQQEYI